MRRRADPLGLRAGHHRPRQAELLANPGKL